MRILLAALSGLSTFNRRAGSVCQAGAQLLLAVMTFVILLQVFRRYVLSSPLIWPEEAARYLMVWMTFLVVPVVYRNDALVRLETISERLPPRFRVYLEIMLHGLVCATALVLMIESAWMVERGARFDSSALGVPMSRVFAILPASFALTALVSLEKILRHGVGISEKPESLPSPASEPARETG